MIKKPPTSSTLEIPQVSHLPKHIAIIMDGNGRWAAQRNKKRIFGHAEGLETVRKVVTYCAEQGVEYLTLFAFSSENWRRPADEVSFLMSLFMKAIDNEVRKLHRNGIRLRVVGNLEEFGKPLLERITSAEALTKNNTRLTLSIAANYGGRWDIMQAVKKLQQLRPELGSDFTEADLTEHFAMSYAPEPDLFIRTGGEQRISNFLLWQLAYAELFFCDTLWPDFDAEQLAQAVAWYGQRERRFGRTSAQLTESDKC